MAERTTAARRRGDTYRGRSRLERATDRRERILGAALQLYGARDHDAVTVAHVCTAARVSKRYFYEHFTNREALLAAVYQQQNQWLLAGVMAAAPRHPRDLPQLLAPMMRALVRMLHQHPDRAHVIYANGPRTQHRRRSAVRAHASHIGRLISQRLGRPQDPLRYERTVLALTAGITEIVFDWLSRGMTDDADLLAEHLTRVATTMLADR